MNIFKTLILKISNLRFAILLIIFIAISSGIGTFIPQKNSKEEYIDFFNEKPIFGFINGNQVLNLQLDHIYTSNWFLFLLVLLCISLAACSLRRQIPSLKASLKWIDYTDEKKFFKLKLISNYQINETEDYILKADSLLRKKGWSIYRYKNRISARKGLIGKFGPIIVHIGLIILLIGSAYGNFTSQSKEEFLRPGESLDLINETKSSKVTVKLKNFLIEREIDGKPIQFVNAKVLRLACNSALNKDEFTGEAKVDADQIPEDIHPLSMNPVGNYAVGINWSDGHASLMPYDLIFSLAK